MHLMYNILFKNYFSILFYLLLLFWEAPPDKLAEASYNV